MIDDDDAEIARMLAKGAAESEAMLRELLTSGDAARWMKAEVEREGYLCQSRAANYIQHVFGAGYIYNNPDGGTSISREVLKAFMLLTRQTVVWERSNLQWRTRCPGESAKSKIGGLT